MDKITSHNEQTEINKGNWLKNKLVPLLILALVIAITIGIFYFYKSYPSKADELKGYGYLGAFLISLLLNATVILPAGNILVIATLGATLPSATIVGLAGGAGAAIGEITGYMTGYSGHGIAEKNKFYNRVEDWVKRWGTLTIFTLSLLPFIFDLAAIAAGVLRFPFWKFLLLCWLGRTILYITVALIGSWSWVVLVALAALAFGLAIARWAWKQVG